MPVQKGRLHVALWLVRHAIPPGGVQVSVVSLHRLQAERADLPLGGNAVPDRGSPDGGSRQVGRSVYVLPRVGDSIFRAVVQGWDQAGGRVQQEVSVLLPFECQSQSGLLHDRVLWETRGGSSVLLRV
uniref:(northern house mosquito) hypothetical protein n=1 Tax=Culex pipiens TaxID=7175 RepID=A0A8D8MUQ1_CULPI